MVILFFLFQTSIIFAAHKFNLMRLIRSIIFLSIVLLLAAPAVAQNESSYSLTKDGVIKTVETEGVTQQFNIAKPIVLLKTKYELGTEEGYSRFSVESARLGVKGDLSKLFSYNFLFDLCAETKLTVLDLNVTIKPLKRLSFVVGQQPKSLFNSWTISPNAVEFVNAPFIGKYFTSSRDIGVTAKYAIKNNGFPINAELNVFNGSGTLNPTWNKALALGGKLEFGSSKEGFRTSIRFYNPANAATGGRDLFVGADVRYATKDFKIEAEYMTKQYTGTTAAVVPEPHSTANVQSAYSIPANNSFLSAVEPHLRWDALGYSVYERGFGVNRITAGVNFILKTTVCTSMFRINYEHYLNNSMDLSAFFTNAVNNENKLGIDFLLYF